ncbi:hypothetical protein SAMN06273572_1068 [Monaibacterium marinum]|uniref:Uncharacterized protein n=1 Tax=Pontivivens marinum TaxID=1690039 RepID=A0A2C9CUE7_9RHOB|nr:hypothetical protein [Monaibacterium marinum]SOH94858.1 hypothetical protein SAMN06273572_1068 [Monaibacterium marinum]
MDRTKHKITVHTSCRHPCTQCRAARNLTAHLHAALNVADGVLAADFEISGQVMTDCDGHECSLRYHVGPPVWQASAGTVH